MAEQRGRPTIWDVAELAGVSIATVSRYMNGTQAVSKAASNAIAKAMAQLDYVPNANVRSIKLGQTRTVGIIVPDISNFFQARVCRRVEHLLYQKRYSLVIASTGNNTEKERSCIHNFLERRVDGLLVSSAGQNNDLLGRAAKGGLPLVLFESYQPELPDLDYVLEDSYGHACRLTRSLLERGHRRISFLKGFEHSTVSEARFAGFCDTLCAAGLAPDPALIWEGCRDRADCVRVFEALRREPGLFTAVATTTPEQMKFLVMEANRQGVRIPQDVSLTGFGIEDYTALFPFSATCVVSDPLANADALVELILRRMDEVRTGKPPAPAEKRIIPCQFFTGNSVACVTP